MTIGNRPTRKKEPDAFLFDMPEDWRDYWWGMPSFEQGDARPQYKITLNFMTAEDLAEFAKVSGIPVTVRSDSAWFPHQQPLNGEYEWDGPKQTSRYPVCIPSKGRAECQKTGNALERMGVEHRFFVEQTEYAWYCKNLGEARVVKMPFNDLGQGSIPARNFIWDWAKENGHKRHWVVDDNIVSFYRCTNNRRVPCRTGGLFVAMEDFVDRFENVALFGPHDIAFVADRDPKLSPVLWNTRVYSCILIDTSISERWRGRYNEDTDLSLRLLKLGYVTGVCRSLCMDKPATSGAKGKALPGGNTDNVYNTGDHRKAFAESLKKQHPDCVEVVWKFNRWHHNVDYSAFKNNKPKMRDGLTFVPVPNEYGMELVRIKK
jgi:hypothetical protein